MSIIGREDIEAADGAITIKPGDVLTPLARDRARELGVELRFPGPAAPPARAPRPSPPAQPAPPPRAADGGLVNSLYRRGAPVPAPMAPSGGKRPRVAVIGAGHVGSITTQRLAESGLFAAVALIDVVDGLAAGVALDLWHGAALGRFDTLITGGTDLAALAGADYVVLTAGRARTPGMTRTDLTQANAEIVGPIAEAIAQHAPSSVIVVVTNPLEEMTHLTQQRSGFPASRVLGMAGVLDTARFAALVGLTGVCPG
jgi:malate dehydrogenase